MSTDRRALILADAAVDAVGTSIAPAAVLVQWASDDDAYPLGGEIIAMGSPDDVRYVSQAKGAAVLVQRNCVIMPGLVNAHTHLDLTHIGPQPHDPGDGFPAWGRMIMQRRASSAEGIRSSVRQGIAQLLAGGIVAVGDIAGVGSVDAAMELQESVMTGVSFLEYFGFGDAAEESAAQANEALSSLECHSRRVKIGLGPHAPYSASVLLYDSILKLAKEHRTRVCTHLAESPAEHDLIATGDGEMRVLLRDIGIWNDAVASEFGTAKTPVEHLEGVLEHQAMLLVHLNDVSDSDLDTVAKSGSSVAYCPRSGEYFGNERAFGSHRYQEMQSRGIRVVLGTDSIVNLPAEAGGESPTLSILPEMRLLHARDGMDWQRLIRMGTTDGAVALGLEESAFTLRPGPVAGIVSVPIDPDGPGEPMEKVLTGSGATQLLGPGARRALSGRVLGA